MDFLFYVVPTIVAAFLVAILVKKFLGREILIKISTDEKTRKARKK